MVIWVRKYKKSDAAELALRCVLRYQSYGLAEHWIFAAVCSKHY